MNILEYNTRRLAVAYTQRRLEECDCPWARHDVSYAMYAGMNAESVARVVQDIVWSINAPLEEW